ncbi:MAG TPA: SMC family ATPase [Dehalococcoidia bacterium]|nr:SMC family ATPase [Dehalococcoidia bacterium]
MVPLRLRLHNFLCYRENCPPLDFTGISMACLSGENGHGKSALLDAITWAVWGQARGKSDDELIHLGHVDMEVEFDFRVGDARYRALRKRRKGTASSPGRTLLEFQVLSGEAWKPLSGASVRETQQQIIDAVRLDYETFRNSAFLMQGRADEFTIKPPNDRKKVLAEILGLSAYDGYEVKARDERRRWEAEARRLDVLLEQYAGVLAREPEHRRERDEMQAELTAIEADLAQQRELQTALREAEKAVQLLRAQAESAAKERDTAEQHVARAGAELARQCATLDGLAALLARAATIRSDYAALRAAREHEAEQSQRLRAVSALQRDEEAARRQIEREEQALTARAVQQETEAKRQRAIVARVHEAENERTALTAARDELDLLERRLREARLELEEQSNTAGQLKVENDRLLADMKELKRKQTELELGGARCPVCRTELGEEGKARVRDEYEVEGRALAERYRHNTPRRDEAEHRIAALKGEVNRVEADSGRRRQTVERRAAELDRLDRDAAEAMAALPEIERELVELTHQLTRSAFAAEPRRQLEQARSTIARTGYDRVAHDHATAEVRRLAAAEEEHLRLQRAEETERAAREAAGRAARELAEWSERRDVARANCDRLAEQLGAQPDPRPQLQRLAEQIGALEGQERRTRQALGAAEQKLEDCAVTQRLQTGAQAELAAARGKEQIYEDLAVAFGRRGVQALIIDSVLPEIEGEANRLLARMTNGRMSVALSTQRATQKGTVAETLDVTISDELGTRAYELFSGGEAFRINLALRIALSKLLAHRAGAQIPTLIVDEGFGTQDAAGRERLIEAMSAVSSDFECMIVITHIDELKDQFEQQIHVEKTPEGSIARVM